MKRKQLFKASIALNIVLVATFLALAFIYRDKIAQRFVSLKGNPAIIMYGNSITAQGKWVELLGRTDVMNNALPGQCTYHFLKQIQSHVVYLHPKVCFLKGGINDITVGVRQEQIQQNFQAMLEILVKNNITPVVTLTVFEQNDQVSKKEVELLNAFLTSYCKRHQITTIDLNQYISDSTGLKKEYAVDKTHLNAPAYKVWAREIKRVLKEKNI